jgi:phosphotransferase system HPr (HPr) family protein
MSTDAAALRQTVTVNTPNGLHMIPCSMVAKVAQQFQSTIVLCKADVRADAKRVLELLTLGAGHGTQLELEITGDDAQDAMERILELFDGDFSVPGTNNGA